MLQDTKMRNSLSFTNLGKMLAHSKDYHEICVQVEHKLTYIQCPH